MYLLKLQTHKHGNSIYFTRDNMVCFPKSGHIYVSFHRVVKIHITLMRTNIHCYMLAEKILNALRKIYIATYKALCDTII